MTKRKSSSSRSRSRSQSSSRSRRSSSRSSRKKKTPREPLWSRMTPDQRLDFIGLTLFFGALLTALSLLSNQGDLTGWWNDVLQQAFGWGMYSVPVILGGVGLWLVLRRRFEERLAKLSVGQTLGINLGFILLIITLHLIASFLWPMDNFYDLARDGVGGGFSGALLLDLTVQAVGKAGAIAMILIGWLLVVSLTAQISPADAIRVLVQGRSALEQHPAVTVNGEQIPLPDKRKKATGPPAEARILGDEQDADEKPTKSRSKRKSKEDDDIAINAPSRSSNGSVEVAIPPVLVGSQKWRLPVVNQILEVGSEQYYSEELIRKQVRIIEETLMSLSAPVRVREINQGPVVTQFGAEPLFLTTRSGKTTKVKVSKIANLADDLALALSARSIRIQAPIPGKGLVGIEVPNEEPVVVSLRDTMESDSFSKIKGRLRLGLGQDVSGQAVAADLRRMPHLLIAGATGSGKSVCVNAVVAALLLQNTPDTLQLLMVDPKRVELTQYNGIPHLLTPVIVDVERVVPTLRWVMREMDSRYRRFAQVGARNIDDYNRRVKKLEEEKPIPYIVVLVDELADMMMQAPEETERVICRLAQMARATGIHLIIATQRPSVDVVTGLIKANFPARIAFAVASSVDSRVILDMPGAERLLGRGDMLFMPPDVSQPLRLQGAFVSDHELEKLIAFWRNAVEPDYEPDQVNIPHPAIAETLGTASSATQPTFPEFDDTSAAMQFEDVLLPEAVEIFLAENRASISLLQRRLRIGYTRAARLVDVLTDMGIVTMEKKGQFRKINRAVGEKLLESLQPEGEEV